MREYYEQLCANKFDNLEMDDFLETYSPPRLSQEETDNLNRPIARSEIKSVKTNDQTKLPTNKVQGQMASQANSTKHTRKNLH